MADSGFGTVYTQNDPGASYSARKKMLKNGTKQMKKKSSMMLNSQLQDLPMAKARTIWQQNKCSSVGL